MGPLLFSSLIFEKKSGEVNRFSSLFVKPLKERVCSEFCPNEYPRPFWMLLVIGAKLELTLIKFGSTFTEVLTLLEPNELKLLAGTEGILAGKNDYKLLLNERLEVFWTWIGL